MVRKLKGRGVAEGKPGRTYKYLWGGSTLPCGVAIYEPQKTGCDPEIRWNVEHPMLHLEMAAF